jgi:hypothetical protein
MGYRTFGLLALGLSLAVASVTSSAEEQKLSYSNKWRIKFDETAKSAGTISFRLTPKEGGTPVEVTAQIADGRGENGIAQDVEAAFKAGVDKATYHVEVDDGEDVLVKKRKGPDFALELVESSVVNTRIVVHKE